MNSSPPAGLSAGPMGRSAVRGLRARPAAGRLCLLPLSGHVDPDPARLPARPAQSPSTQLVHVRQLTRKKGGAAGAPATRRGASVVVFRAEAGDQVFALPHA